MKTIEIKMSEDNKKIIFEYDVAASKKIIEIKISESNDTGLNTLYDFIISNIDEIVINSKITKDESTLALAALKFVEVLEGEIKAIKEYKKTIAIATET